MLRKYTFQQDKRSTLLLQTLNKIPQRKLLSLQIVLWWRNTNQLYMKYRQLS